jgi:hypothetical protein
LSAPSYSRSVNGSFNFTSTSSQCAIVSGIGSQSRFTIETWISPNSSQDEYASIFSTPWLGSSTRINYACYFTGYSSNRLVYCNIYQSSADGTAGWGASPISAIVQPNTWSHLVFSFNGSNMNLYVNGVAATPVAYGGVAGLNTYDNIFIGRRWDDVNYYSGGMATFRVYSRALSLSEVQQNFNVTKDRFTGVLNENSINQKYGSRFADTYTITAGSESITATFTTNALSGISWDTSTARSLRLLLQDTLTPGTYYDTVTAVDIYGSTTRLPLIFTIAKADTVTVFIDTPTVLSYTGNRAVLTPTLRVNGLIATESGTAQSVTVRYKPGGGTCATGGYCRVGDIGPGGGIVFIDTSTASSDGRIYEVAPYNWSGSDDLATVATYCSNGNSNIGATQIGIGWGETNTNLAKSSCLGGAVALVNNFNQSNSTGYSDWFIPSTNEAIELIKIPTTAGLVRVGSAWTTGLYGYWTSTEVSASTQRSIGGSGSSWNVSSAVLKGDAANNMVRPVRAFRPCWAIDTCTSLLTTDTPTFAGDYSIVPASLIIGSGSLNNYTAVVYQSTPLSISKIAPRALTIPWINTNYPDTFTISIPVTAGVGALRYSTINGTATGCTLDYRKIYTSTQGTCFVTITRQADRNFIADTTTATIFFFTFVLNQPTGQVGSGPGIALNGATALSVDTTTPPSITGLSTLTLSLGAGGTFTVTGTGFSAGSLSVKFWRNRVVVPTASTATTITFNVSDIASSGAMTGRISVTTVAGQAISVDTLTITP